MQNLVNHLNYTEEDIVEYHDVFTEKECSTIYQYLQAPNWRYGHVSSTKPEHSNSPPFWDMQLNNNDFFTNHLLNRICNIVGDDLKLVSIYANGQTYGLGGQPHVDANDDKGRSFIFYANTSWDIRWNGKTVFLLNETPIFCIPNKNKAVYFPGVIPHYAEETTRCFGGLRTTVIWKMRLN